MTTTKSRTKADVTFHSDGFREGRPAVNVKVHNGRHPLPIDLMQTSDDGGVTFYTVTTDPEFTWDWIDENLTDEESNAYFEMVCSEAWERLQEAAVEIFGPGVKVYSEGRSGGWAVVHGIKDFESWDAIDLGKWQRFEQAARELADDIPYQFATSVYFNVYEAREVTSDPNQPALFPREDNA